MNAIGLTNLGTNHSNTTWTPSQGIRTSVLDATNPVFLRNIFLDSTALTLFRQGQTPVILTIANFLAAAAVANPNISWAPLITVQPPNRTVVHPAATTFPITATSETTITYQWQISSDNGVTWGNQANTGVYSGATTATLAISDSTSLNGKQYRCVVTNATGNTNTSAAILTVT